MTVFTNEEIDLICIYDPGNRVGTIGELKDMMRYLMPDETDLHDLVVYQILISSRFSLQSFDSNVNRI